MTAIAILTVRLITIKKRYLGLKVINNTNRSKIATVIPVRK